MCFNDYIFICIYILNRTAAKSAIIELLHSQWETDQVKQLQQQIEGEHKEG